MAEWLYEDGIGERRAALVEDGRIVELHVERDSDGVQPGERLHARLNPREGSGAWRSVTLPSGEEAMLRSLPPGLSDGATLLVEVTRSAVAEADIVKRAMARPAEAGARPMPAPSLLDRISASGTPVCLVAPHQPDALEQAGWSEWIEAATSGHIAFSGGLLRMTLTPAMTVFDVDGELPPSDLARVGITAMARAIRALGIGGSIVIDLPTLADKGQRVAVAEAFDAAMPPPFERTAVNGYGLLQVIRPRTGPSMAERWQFQPVESAALTLLRAAARQGAARPGQPLTLAAHPAVVRWLEARSDLAERLARESGATVHLRAEADRAIAAAHVC
ncbi:ribonuclease [Sphingomonas lacunae]|uniref:Ribonuclease n=1 Tax=Sphingomonas lacunae TaxID=2698828 RepID=A0A6M4AQI0_9SPHN|nr:ribonuclease [Sphingomonas lacunae]QJQ31285.1 ribonuclease [Sphingomonas lacunae]